MPAPLSCRIARFLAREPLLPFWDMAYKVSLRGLGYENGVPAINGEDRFLRHWLNAEAPPQPIIFDVGGHEGDFTAVALCHPHAMVHIFEPNPASVEKLRQRFEGRGRAIINPIGLSDAEEERYIYDFADSPGSCRASFLPEMVDGRQVAVKATLRTLDGYCAEESIECIDYLKLDVEGFEKNVLLGARRMLAAGNIGIIQMEQNIHAIRIGFSVSVIAEMLPRYDIYRLLPRGMVPVVTRAHAYQAKEEIFRYHNLVAIPRAPSV
jgi:FkbM family methyltransferase